MSGQRCPQDSGHEHTDGLGCSCGAVKSDQRQMCTHLHGRVGTCAAPWREGSGPLDGLRSGRPWEERGSGQTVSWDPPFPHLRAEGPGPPSSQAPLASCPDGSGWCRRRHRGREHVGRGLLPPSLWTGHWRQGCLPCCPPISSGGGSRGKGRLVPPPGAAVVSRTATFHWKRLGPAGSKPGGASPQGADGGQAPRCMSFKATEEPPALLGP